MLPTTQDTPGFEQWWTTQGQAQNPNRTIDEVRSAYNAKLGQKPPVEDFGDWWFKQGQAQNPNKSVEEVARAYSVSSGKPVKIGNDSLDWSSGKLKFQTDPENYEWNFAKNNDEEWQNRNPASLLAQEYRRERLVKFSDNILETVIPDTQPDEAKQIKRYLSLGVVRRKNMANKHLQTLPKATQEKALVAEKAWDAFIDSEGRRPDYAASDFTNNNEWRIVSKLAESPNYERLMQFFEDAGAGATNQAMRSVRQTADMRRVYNLGHDDPIVGNTENTWLALPAALNSVEQRAGIHAMSTSESMCEQVHASMCARAREREREHVRAC